MPVGTNNEDNCSDFRYLWDPSFHRTSWYCLIWGQGSFSAVWYELVKRVEPHTASYRGFVFQSSILFFCLIDRRSESHLGLLLQKLCYSDWLSSVWRAITVLGCPLTACLKLHQAHLGFQRGFALSLFIKNGRVVWHFRAFVVWCSSRPEAIRNEIQTLQMKPFWNCSCTCIGKEINRALSEFYWEKSTVSSIKERPGSRSVMSSLQVCPLSVCNGSKYM